MKTAAAQDGRLICVMCGNYGECEITEAFYDNVACTEEFLSWAAANGVYLVRADSSVDPDSSSATSWFLLLMTSYGDSGSYYYTRMYFAYPNSPMVAVSKGEATGSYGYGKIGTVTYAHTVGSAIAGFASVLGTTVVAGGVTSCRRRETPTGRRYPAARPDTGSSGSRFSSLSNRSAISRSVRDAFDLNASTRLAVCGRDSPNRVCRPVRVEITCSAGCL